MRPLALLAAALVACGADPPTYLVLRIDGPAETHQLHVVVERSGQQLVVDVPAQPLAPFSLPRTLSVEFEPGATGAAQVGVFARDGTGAPHLFGEKLVDLARDRTVDVPLQVVFGCGANGQVCCSARFCATPDGCVGGACACADCCGAEGEPCCRTGARAPCDGDLVCDGSGTCIRVIGF